jgi:hypothetical protein
MANEFCAWARDGEDSDTWVTQCDHYFTINEGTPRDNDMKFCCFCGKPVDTYLPEEDL